MADFWCAFSEADPGAWMPRRDTQDAARADAARILACRPQDRVHILPPIEARIVATTSNIDTGNPHRWYPWPGGPCPVPVGTFVDAFFEAGGLLRGVRARFLSWELRRGHAERITLFRLSPSAGAH